MGLDLTALLALAVTQACTAAGVYAALRSDIREALIRATEAQRTAERAHSRIDSHHARQ
jgi:hypothetical protein